MEKKKWKKRKVVYQQYFLVIAIILIIVMGALLYMQKTEAYRQIAELENNASEMQETIDDLQEKIDSVSNIVNTTDTEENILLYKGSEISKKVGSQFIDLGEMEINDNSKRKYNTTYYNYENGKFQGTTIGAFGEEIIDGNMEIIEVPTYDGTKIRVLKYSNNKVEGEINLQASVLP